MSSESLQPASGPARRTVFAAVGVVGIAATLTACGDSDDDSSGAADVAPSGEAGDGGDAGAGGEALAKTSEIPEGGGKVFEDKGVVVVQPTAGDFKAYSSKCPHQGCAVKGISDGIINCPCHGSQFDVADGSVKKGPATSGLPAAEITVSGDSIMLA